MSALRFGRYPAACLGCDSSIFRRRSVKASARPRHLSSGWPSYESVEAVGAVEATRDADTPRRWSAASLAAAARFRAALAPRCDAFGQESAAAHERKRSREWQRPLVRRRAMGIPTVSARSLAPPSPRRSLLAPAAAEFAPAVESFDEGVGEPVTAYAEQPTIEPPSFTAAPDYVEPPRDERICRSGSDSFAPEPPFTPEPPVASATAVASGANVRSLSLRLFRSRNSRRLRWNGSQRTKKRHRRRCRRAGRVRSLGGRRAGDVRCAGASRSDRCEEQPAFTAPEPVTASAAPVVEDSEPIGQGQPVPYLTPAPTAEAAAELETPREPIAPIAPIAAAGVGLAGIGALRHSVAPLPAPEVVSQEPTAQQPTTPVNMPQPTQPTPAPVIRTGPQGPSAPSGGAAPQATRSRRCSSRPPRRKEPAACTPLCN